jgi:diguanylate cyclase (GGDEF)-like protein/PAS domain S-box-containing protein
MLYPLSYGGSVGLQYPTPGASIWNRSEDDSPEVAGARCRRRSGRGHCESSLFLYSEDEGDKVFYPRVRRPPHSESSELMASKEETAVTGSTPTDALEILRLAGSHPVVRGFPEGVIVVFDQEFRYLCAGGHGLSIVGLTQELIEGKTIYQVFPPEVSRILEEPYRRALLGEEATLDIPFGGSIFLHRIAPLSDADGTIVAGIGFALDVSEARRAEQALRQSEESLREEQRRLRDAEAIGHSGSWEWDMVTDVITWSDGLFSLHGLDRQSFDGGYAEAASRVHPEDRATVDAAMEAIRGDQPTQFRYRIFRAGDRELRWFDSRGSAVFEDGTLVRLVGAVADVTEQVQAEAEIVEANAFQEAVIAASPDYTFISDLQTGAFIYGSRERDMLGRTAQETESLGTEVIAALVHPDDQPVLRSLNDEASKLADGQVLEVRYRLRHVDGTWHWFSRHVVPFRRDEEGSVIQLLGVLRDISDVVEAEERLTHDALHDVLTGLPNRALLLDRLEAALARSSRESHEVAVLFCDLDGFKHINDTAGHSAGDAVLVETARRLTGALREADTVARVGGDEFVLVVEPWNRAEVNEGGNTADEVTRGRDLTLRLADRVIRAISQPFAVHGTDYQITVSIGVTYRPPVPNGSTAKGASDVIDEADAAMYTAKRQGKNRVAVFAGEVKK